MKEFYVCSNDIIPVTRRFSEYATMAFWCDCHGAKNTCAAVQHLQNLCTTTLCKDWNSQYLFNFSPTISIDEIRKAIYTAHDICRNCKKIKIK